MFASLLQAESGPSQVINWGGGFRGAPYVCGCTYNLCDAQELGQQCWSSLGGLWIHIETWTWEPDLWILTCRRMRESGTTDPSALCTLCTGSLMGSAPSASRFPRDSHSWKAAPRGWAGGGTLSRLCWRQLPCLAWSLGWRGSRSSAIYKLSATLRWRLRASDADSWSSLLIAAAPVACQVPRQASGSAFRIRVISWGDRQENRRPLRQGYLAGQDCHGSWGYLWIL